MRRSVVLGWALALSLAVNAGLVGYMIGAGGGGKDRRDPLRAVAAELSPDGRAILRETARQARPAIRQARRDLRAARENLIATMRARPDDVDAIADAMLMVREASGDLQQQVQRVPLATLLQLDGAERDAFIDGMEKGLRRRR